LISRTHWISPILGLLIAATSTQAVSAREETSLGLELFKLQIPKLLPALNCNENIHHTTRAFIAKVRAMTPAMTALDITILDFNRPAYAAIAAVLIDDGAPTLLAFDEPGTKTIIIQGHNLGLHILKISTLDVFPGGAVTESSSTATCIKI